MPNKYEVQLSDGRKFVVEADAPPSEQDVMAALATQGKTPEPPKVSTQDLMSQGPSAMRATQGQGTRATLRMIRDNPVEAAAMGGAMLAAPFTGGGSILGGMAAAGLGGAGGAGAAIAGRQLLTGKPEPASNTLATMAEQGATNAVGEGAGRGIVKAADVVVPKILKGILRPSKRVQKEFGDVVGTMRQERIPVGQSEEAAQRGMESAGRVDEILKAKDAERPRVAGYLPPAKEAVPMGTPSIKGEMPGQLVGAQPLPLRRPPMNTTGTGRFAERIEDLDPVETLYSSRLTRTGHPIPDLPPAPELSGPGVWYREMQAAPGRGAYPGQVDPRELLSGLQEIRSELGNRALNTRATDELSALEQEYLSSHVNPMSLTETQGLKRAEQDLANTAFRAQDAGNPINEVSANFHKGMAGGARQAIERQAPEVIPHNQRAQQMMGLEQALSDAEARSGAGLITLNPLSVLGSLAPKLGSNLTFAADAAAQGTQGTQARLIRQALLSLLAGESQQE